MKLKSFTAVRTEYIRDEKSPNTGSVDIHWYDADGNDWYDEMVKFGKDTYKIVYDNKTFAVNVINPNADMCCADEGVTITEIESLPENYDGMNWKYTYDVNQGVMVLNVDLLNTIAYENEQAWIDAEIAPLRDEALTDEISDDNMVYYKKLVKYRKALTTSVPTKFDSFGQKRPKQ